MSEECKKIKQPVLLLNGEFDGTRDFSVQPYFNGIPKVKWCTISGASHSSQVEKPEKYAELVVEFLNN
jgi:pimeloyl-ACP methyl ester carboxylesterase